MEQNFITRPLDTSDRDDIYSNLKSDFGKIFHDQNLMSLANPADLGFHDFGKSFPDQYPSHPEDHQKPLESDNAHNHRLHSQREDLANYQMNPTTYGSLGLSHHNNGHYNSNHNNNFGYNGAKQQNFQQEHLGYPGYHHNHHNHHHQPYYHQNQHHYEGQGAQSGHGNNMDYYQQHPRDMGDNHHVDDSLSMMWGNGPSKAMNHRNMPMNGFYNGDLNKMKGNNGFVSYEQPNDPRNYQNMYDYDAKRNHMMRMQQEMGMAPVRKPLEVSQRGLNNMMPGANGMDLKGAAGNKTGLGAVKYAPKLSPKKSGVNGKFDLDDDEDGEDGYGDEKGRSTRGLRVLSLKVKDIVMQKKRTSYKEVAETLTHELRQKTNGKPLKEESKDEQNVKRRVYDALNVLIAAGVLRKEGKIVYCDQNMANNGQSGKRPNGEKDKLLRDIEEARKKNKAKIEVLHELIFKCLAIKNLVKNNKEKLEAEGDPEKKPKARPSSVNATRIEVIQENPALKPKNEDVIRFPFIVLLSSSPENSMNLNMDTLQKQLAIESKKPFNIFGDIDVLLKMGLHYVSRKMFDENIPVELQKFVPKYFLAGLN